VPIDVLGARESVATAHWRIMADSSEQWFSAQMTPPPFLSGEESGFAPAGLDYLLGKRKDWYACRKQERALESADVWNRDTFVGNGNQKCLRESQVN
jgi:hypothetical protein